MQVRKIEHSDVDTLLELFNQMTKTPNFLYERLNEKQFTKKFIESTNAYDIHTYVATFNRKPIGFISGVYDVLTKKAYVSMIIVDSKYQRQGVGTLLLETLEARLLSHTLQQRKIEIVFFNPIGFSWIIPGTQAVHPNAPGIDQKSDAYIFFKHHKYIDFAVQNVYYRDITTYEYSIPTKEVITSVDSKGFKFGYYDVENNHGLNETLDNLGSADWKKQF